MAFAKGIPVGLFSRCFMFGELFTLANEWNLQVMNHRTWTNLNTPKPQRKKSSRREQVYKHTTANVTTERNLMIVEDSHHHVCFDTESTEKRAFEHRQQWRHTPTDNRRDWTDITVLNDRTFMNLNIKKHKSEWTIAPWWVSIHQKHWGRRPKH